MGPIPFIFRYNTSLGKRQVEDCLYNYKRQYPQLFEPGVGIFDVLKREERKPTRCNNIDGLLSIMDVDY